MLLELQQMQPSRAHVKRHKLSQVFKQAVTSLFTSSQITSSCYQVFALLIEQSIKEEQGE